MRKRCVCTLRIVVALQLVILTLGSVQGQQQQATKAEVFVKTFLAEDMLIQNKRVLLQKKGTKAAYSSLSLKPGLLANNDEADLKLRLSIPQSGLYLFETFAEPIDKENYGKDLSSPYQGSYIRIQQKDQRATNRVLYDKPKGGSQVLGKFSLAKGQTELALSLPAGLRLVSFKVRAYEAPVPIPEALAYQPTVVPPAGHPRLWVNKESLVTVQGRLQAEENKLVWEKLRLEALKPYTFDFDPQVEITYQEDLELMLEKKAFYYLISNDKAIGQETVRLLKDYLSVLEFGTAMYGDISREIGRTIYTAALVYDWCYALLSDTDKLSLRKAMLRLAHDMEIGWPPFHGPESIINGHGNEAQICRDLLAMSIAIYDEDPEPYKYTSYTVLEQLVPMRKFEYASGRHNQGIDYGGYRFGWEMHAVWFYYRMLGREVFDGNLKNLPYYWVYMRTPDGKMLRDGDMFNIKYANSENFYWKNPQTMLLSYAYAGDPIIKGEFYKQGALPDNPVLFLLLNDPALPAQLKHDKLPLTHDFGDVLGGMIARTGWDQRPESKDVVAEIKGGGYHFGNHQHADAGAIQIYYHGNQVADLGLYLSYGPPYDFNFNKRSVSHSMLLVRDPKEPLLFRTEANDGGTRFSQLFPRTAAETMQNPWFSTGTVKTVSYGPDKQKPAYSYFQVDLTAAYTAKIKDYTRSLCFVNMENDSIPAVIILADHVESADSSFRKYWQINTLNKPLEHPNGWQLYSKLKGVQGNTFVEMLYPKVGERDEELLTGELANNVFGFQYKPNSAWPEAKGTRIMVSPKQGNYTDNFLTVFQMTADGVRPYPLQANKLGSYYYVEFANKLVCIPARAGFVEEEIVLEKLSAELKTILFTGLAAGHWTVQEGDGKLRNIEIKDRDNVYSLESRSQKVILRPHRKYGLNDYQTN